MDTSGTTDWEIGEKTVPVNGWRDSYEWVEEFHASPDGEKVAAIVNLGPGEFGICVNGETGENTFEKIWYPRFSPDGRFTALVSEDGEWTLSVDGIPWAEKFDYVWQTLFSDDGKRIAVAFQKDLKYGMAVDGVPWETTFPNMSNMVFASDGSKTAASVLTEPLHEAEIFKFQKGLFSVAENGQAWENRYMNVWNTVFGRGKPGQDGLDIAAEVRVNPHEYTIAVNGKAWPKTYQSVWAPAFHPETGRVTAPVRVGGAWTLAEDGAFLWDGRYTQLWNHRHGPDGRKIMAIVAPSFGKWTVAVDDRPWPVSFDQMVSDAVFSPDGDRVAALAKTKEKWTVVADGVPWPESYEMAWTPVFSPDGRVVTAKVEKDGKYTVAVNGKLWHRAAEAIWNPVFNSEGDRILVRSIENGVYVRRVVGVDEILG